MLRCQGESTGGNTWPDVQAESNDARKHGTKIRNVIARVAELGLAE